MNNCYLSLGSNQRSPQRQLRLAIQALNSLPQSVVKKASTFHRTKAWGNQKQQDFYNLALHIETRLPPLTLLAHCQAIEKKLGRVRRKHWGPRVIDIDIIFYADRKINLKHLSIPHPHWKKRDFVLKPLSELISSRIKTSETLDS